ncbi:MAG: hypothetical protein E7306_00525 [Butyrivibrio sp.]|nr:hypothetical protein [Butyrivibrio sp.]
MKKRLLLMTLAVTTMVLAGCGSSAGEETAEAENSSAIESSATEDTTESSAEEKSESAEATAEATQISEESVALAAALDPNTEYVFGTAALSYEEFYSGDVSSTESYDAVSSATSKKFEIFPNMNTDYVDETTNAEGYKILGVKNVNVAIPADQADAYAKLNETFVQSTEEPKQFKIVNVEGDNVEYSATVFNVAATVTDAKAELLTGTNWGDYQLNILENSTSYIKASREDESAPVAADIEGVILETKSGLKVGMEHLQSIWVLPYEVSFNIEADNTHNTRVKFDNLAELSKLEKEEIVSATFINQNDTYVYTFDPVYVKPVYRDVEVTGTIDEKEGTLTLVGVPGDLENTTLSATYIVGQGHDSVRTVIYDGELSGDKVEIDAKALEEAKSAQVEEGRYVVAVSSDNFANIAVTVE